MDTRFEQICTFGAFAHTPDVNTTAYEYRISPCLAEMQRRSNIVLTVEIFGRKFLATRKFALATKSENLWATWPQGFHLKVEP